MSYQSTLSCMNNVKRNNGSERPQVPVYIDAVFVGDRSGSMRSMGNAPMEGVRDFLEKHMNLYNENGGEVNVTIVTFDTCMEVPFSGDISTLNTNDIERCVNEMKPRNLTRLYDTVLDTIREQNNRKTGNPNQKMIFSLFTDGYDNVSTNTSKTMSDAIIEHKNSGVVCNFLAANQDAIVTGEMYGFNGGNSIQVTSDPIYAMNAFGACAASGIRSATTGDVGFTRLERISSATVADRTSLFTHVSSPLVQSHLLPPIRQL